MAANAKLLLRLRKFLQGENAAMQEDYPLFRRYWQLLTPLQNVSLACMSGQMLAEGPDFVSSPWGLPHTLFSNQTWPILLVYKA